MQKRSGTKNWTDQKKIIRRGDDKKERFINTKFSLKLKEHRARSSIRGNHEHKQNSPPKEKRINRPPETDARRGPAKKKISKRGKEKKSISKMGAWMEHRNVGKAKPRSACSPEPVVNRTPS